jgi:hypothetical protein
MTNLLQFGEPATVSDYRRKVSLDSELYLSLGTGKVVGQSGSSRRSIFEEITKMTCISTRLADRPRVANLVAKTTRLRNKAPRFWLVFKYTPTLFLYLGGFVEMVCSSFDTKNQKCKETGMKIYEGMDVPCEIVRSKDKCKVVAMRK